MQITMNGRTANAIDFLTAAFPGRVDPLPSGLTNFVEEFVVLFIDVNEIKGKVSLLSHYHPSGHFPH